MEVRLNHFAHVEVQLSVSQVLSGGNEAVPVVLEHIPDLLDGVQVGTRSWQEHQVDPFLVESIYHRDGVVRSVVVEHHIRTRDPISLLNECQDLFSICSWDEFVYQLCVLVGDSSNYCNCTSSGGWQPHGKFFILLLPNLTPLVPQVDRRFVQKIYDSFLLEELDESCNKRVLLPLQNSHLPFRVSGVVGFGVRDPMSEVELAKMYVRYLDPKHLLNQYHPLAQRNTFPQIQQSG